MGLACPILFSSLLQVAGTGIASKIPAECPTCNLYRTCKKDGKGYPVGRSYISPNAGGKFIHTRLFGQLQMDH